MAARTHEDGAAPSSLPLLTAPLHPPQEIGFAHMRVLDGLDTMLQIAGLAAKMCCQAQAKGAGKA